ncbi:MAG: HisA/HisF-related TIM barrel protein [Pyrinomonadaceae bacterium]
MTRGWEKEESVLATELAQRVAAAGVERIVYTDVARDGMLSGVNMEQTCAVARESGLKVTASGRLCGGHPASQECKRVRHRQRHCRDSLLRRALYSERGAGGLASHY